MLYIIYNTCNMYCLCDFTEEYLKALAIFFTFSLTNFYLSVTNLEVASAR
jgi:hypothetical protein